MQFVLVRHVETEGNVEHRFNGRTESPLTEHGLMMKEKVVCQLVKMHRRKPFDRVLSSPSFRTAIMGEAFSESTGVSLEIDENLREFDFGPFDGLSAEEAAEKEPALWQEWLMDYSTAKLSEKGCFRDFHANLKKWLEKFDVALEERVLMFTHGGTLNSLMLNLLDLPLESRWHFAVKTGGIVVIDAPEGYGILEAMYSLDDEEN